MAVRQQPSLSTATRTALSLCLYQLPWNHKIHIPVNLAYQVPVTLLRTTRTPAVGRQPSLMAQAYPARPSALAFIQRVPTPMLSQTLGQRIMPRPLAHRVRGLEQRPRVLWPTSQGHRLARLLHQELASLSRRHPVQDSRTLAQHPVLLYPGLHLDLHLALDIDGHLERHRRVQPRDPSDLQLLALDPRFLRVLRHRGLPHVVQPHILCRQVQGPDRSDPLAQTQLLMLHPQAQVLALHKALALARTTPPVAASPQVEALPIPPLHLVRPEQYYYPRQAQATLLSPVFAVSAISALAPQISLALFFLVALSTQLYPAHQFQ